MVDDAEQSNVILLPGIKDDRREVFRVFFDAGIAMPEGYTRMGFAWTPRGPRLYVAAIDLPPMYWGGGKDGGWLPVFDKLDG